MKPSEIIKLARRQTGCTEDIVTTDEAYKFLNFVIEDFGADIRGSDSGFGFDFLNFDIQAGQPQYSIDEDAGEWFNNFPISKLQKVWYLMPDGKWRDLPIHFVDKVDVNKFVDQGEPRICFIVNNCIELLPVPKENTRMQIWGFDYNWELMPDLWKITVGGVQYTRDRNKDIEDADQPFAWTYDTTTIFTDREHPYVGYMTYANYTGTTTAGLITAYEVEGFDSEENIWIPKRWHYVLVEGLKYRMYGNMGVNFETARTNSRIFFDNEKDKALQNIVDRGQEADTSYFPNLNYLNY